MADYGLTKYGLNIKRLDVILEEMHEDLSEKWGVNTKQNPDSLLSVLLTNIADMMAELWELGQDVYNSQYPASAEGMFLDNVGQFAGISRETEAPSYYHILCVGTDGTVIPTETVISSKTNPVTYLYPVAQKTLSRGSFNKAAIKIVSVDGNALTVVLNGNIYSVTPASGTAVRTALTQLKNAIAVDDDFTVSIDENEDLLYIDAIDETSSNSLVFTGNLTTQFVGCVIMFRTEESGDIYLPAGSITDITKAVTGLTSVINVGSYVAGRLAETDSEFRKSYMDKIFSHSERMSESIKSAILNNCQGITAIAVYENSSNSVDADLRPAHSIEVVVDGGESTEIARQILNTKAGGIYTYGSQEVTLVGEGGEEITVRFNRPDYVTTWFHVEISVAQNATLPSNYVDLITDVIVEQVKTLGCGDDLFPQRLLLPKIYSNVPGIDYVTITMETGSDQPESYEEQNVYANSRQRCVTDESKISIDILNE